jgi:protein deglycase
LAVNKSLIFNSGMLTDKRIYLFLADGFEEVEALTPVDVLRRAGFEVKMVSVSDSDYVTGARGIVVKADGLIDDCNFSTSDLLILPGGMPGTANLAASKTLKEGLLVHYERKMPIGAICAAPTILGDLGLLKGHAATCYPGMESRLVGAVIGKEPVAVSLPFITAKGAGASMAFAFELLTVLTKREVSEALARKMIVDY